MYTPIVEQNYNFQTEINENNSSVNNLNINSNNQTDSGILINENNDLDKIEYPNDFNKNEIDMYFTFKRHIQVFCITLISLTYSFIVIFKVISRKNIIFKLFF